MKGRLPGWKVAWRFGNGVLADSRDAVGFTRKWRYLSTVRAKKNNLKYL
jgi:hypothetical protein